MTSARKPDYPQYLDRRHIPRFNVVSGLMMRTNLSAIRFGSLPQDYHEWNKWDSQFLGAPPPHLISSNERLKNRIDKQTMAIMDCVHGLLQVATLHGKDNVKLVHLLPLNLSLWWNRVGHRSYIVYNYLAGGNVGKSSRQVSCAGSSEMVVLIYYTHMNDLDQARLSRLLRKLLEMYIETTDTKVTHTPLNRMSSSYQAPSCW